MELIKHASVKTTNDRIIMGKHHGDCFHKARSIGLKVRSGGESQGFVTSKGRFINRYEGAELAFKNGQIDKEVPMLFSEHLWCEKYNAKHSYSAIKGYEITKGTCDICKKEVNSVYMTTSEGKHTSGHKSCLKEVPVATKDVNVSDVPINKGDKVRVKGFPDKVGEYVTYADDYEGYDYEVKWADGKTTWHQWTDLTSAENIKFCYNGEYYVKEN